MGRKTNAGGDWVNQWNWCSWKISNVTCTLRSTLSRKNGIIIIVEDIMLFWKLEGTRCLNKCLIEVNSYWCGKHEFERWIVIYKKIIYLNWFDKTYIEIQYLYQKTSVNTKRNKNLPPCLLTSLLVFSSLRQLFPILRLYMY